MRPDAGPRNGTFPTDPFLVNGPTINQALLNQMFPGGQLLKNTGVSWDNADRQVPYTDQVTAGYERQLAGNMAISADYVHAFSRDLLMSKDLNAGLRATTASTSPVVRNTPQPELVAAYAVLNTKYPGFGTFSGAVTQPQNIGKIDYDALLVAFNKRFSQNYSARVSYTLAYSRGNTSGNGVAASGFQVLDDMNLDLNEGPGAFDTRHNLVLSGQALVPRTGGLNVSWVVRALSGSPFSLTNNLIDPDRNGTFAEPLAGGRLHRHRLHHRRRGQLHGEGLPGEAQRRRRPGLLQRRPAPGLSSRSGWAPRRAHRRHLQRDQPHQLLEPVGQSGGHQLPGPDQLQHELRAAQAADRRALPVLDEREGGEGAGGFGHPPFFHVR